MPKRKVTCRAWKSAHTQGAWVWDGQEMHRRDFRGAWGESVFNTPEELESDIENHPGDVTEVGPREARKLDAERRAAK